MKDTWGLRRHRDGRWDWVQAPYKVGSEEPLARYQHASIFVGTMMIVVGGRTNTVGENVQLEVYETESSEWHKFDCLQRFRHTIWAVDSTIFMHGGFEKETPNIPTNSIMKIDLMSIFKNLPALKTKLDMCIGAANRKKPGSTPAQEEASRDGRRTPPMQTLARDQNQIRMDRAELEVNPGSGKTVQKPLPRLLEERKNGNAEGQQQTP